MKGLNMVVKQPSTSAATVLVVLMEGHHDRDNIPACTQVHGPCEEVKSLLLPVCIALLVEVTIQ